MLLSRQRTQARQECETVMYNSRIRYSYLVIYYFMIIEQIIVDKEVLNMKRLEKLRNGDSTDIFSPSCPLSNFNTYVRAKNI